MWNKLRAKKFARSKKPRTGKQASALGLVKRLLKRKGERATEEEISFQVITAAAESNLTTFVAD